MRAGIRAPEAQMADGVNRRRWLLGAAGAGAAGALGAFAWRRFDPRTRLFNPLRLDDFALAPVAGLTGADGAPLPGFTAKDFDRPKPVTLFASWCPPCREEHPLMMTLAGEIGAPIYAALYRDSAEAAGKFLRANGNPFARIGDDRSGFFARLVGARGVPTTLVIAPGPTIALRIDGQITPARIRDLIKPALA